MNRDRIRQAVKRVNRAPLRQIVGEAPWLTMADGHQLMGDLLACGHVMPPAEDMMGRVYGRKRRRCGECQKGDQR